MSPANPMPTLRTRHHQASAAKDRLQPALLDRLTDHEPHLRTERPDAVFVNEARLRQALLRDLGWLLNARDAWDHLDMEDLTHARRSVINYGIAPLAGQLLSELDCKHVEQGIRQAILDFEPRILPQTLAVTLQTSTDLLSHHNTLQFEIRCQVWSMPYPLELLLKTSLDLETGQVSLQNLRA
ncbi:type VI secretion system baseplate subunit TssE [Delftia sp. PS-11]|uniref:type VI secretion system baseplate subunit TssE n=1 Tax=Delftia sp. PS-11 TaxID=2767222 RepID=UPI0024589B8D|nr:type VI secretion system baseplate subunit TssE [Delftia sp. PS-11]